MSLTQKTKTWIKRGKERHLKAKKVVTKTDSETEFRCVLLEIGDSWQKSQLSNASLFRLLCIFCTTTFSSKSFNDGIKLDINHPDFHHFQKCALRQLRCLARAERDFQGDMDLSPTEDFSNAFAGQYYYYYESYSRNLRIM